MAFPQPGYLVSPADFHVGQGQLRMGGDAASSSNCWSLHIASSDISPAQVASSFCFFPPTYSSPEKVPPSWVAPLQSNGKVCHSPLTGPGHPCSCLGVLPLDHRRSSVLTVLSQLPLSRCLHTFLCAANRFLPPTPQDEFYFLFLLFFYPLSCLLP